jgi:hypothetical protein
MERTGLVAFDLDNTLGCFDAVYPWGHFFSVEELENSVNAYNLSPHLKGRLRKAETMFVEKIRAYRDFFSILLRPNLDALLKLLIKAKREGTIRAVCIYSNTGSTFTLFFAKRIIEEQYQCPGFFDCLVDANDPIRKYDWEQYSTDDLQLPKTFVGLKRIFKEYCGVNNTIHPNRILFVDDREVKHHLQNEEKNGLTYLQVTPYIPDITTEMRQKIYNIGLEVLLETNLVDSPMYLFSEIFQTQKMRRTQARRFLKNNINGLFDLLEYSENSASVPWLPAEKFKDDTTKIRKVMILFVKRREIEGAKQ